MSYSLQNKKSRSDGAYFENIINNSCEWYKKHGLAFIEKTPEPMHVVRPFQTGGFLAFFEKQAQPDFKGTMKGGQSVVFEAKYTSKDKIEYKRLTDTQLNALLLHHNLGAKAFILVYMGLQDFYRVPFEVWHDMKRLYGRLHMTKSELERFRVEAPNLIVKFLSYEGRDVYSQCLQLSNENSLLKMKIYHLEKQMPNDVSEALYNGWKSLNTGGSYES